VFSSSALFPFHIPRPLFPLFFFPNLIEFILSQVSSFLFTPQNIVEFAVPPFAPSCFPFVLSFSSFPGPLTLSFSSFLWVYPLGCTPFFFCPPFQGFSFPFRFVSSPPPPFLLSDEESPVVRPSFPLLFYLTISPGVAMYLLTSVR